MRPNRLKFVYDSADVKLMDRNKFNVLIVEDDSSQGKALQEALNRAGYNAEWTTSSQQALTLAHHAEYHALVVDCMLPLSNGVDLVNELKPHLASNAEIILISGIFKDRSFIKEAMEKTGASQFLIKPFDLEQIIALIGRKAPKGSPESEDPVLELYGGTLENPVAWLEQHGTLNPLHLPILLKKIQKSRLSGQLLVSQSSPCSISFFEGRVWDVKTADPQSYFGILAVENGYSSTGELEAALKNQGSLPIGQALIQGLSLSPHAVKIILQEQMALRLSQIIQDGTVELRWIPQSFEKPDISLSPERLDSLIHEWLPSKYEDNWLRELFLRWGSRHLTWKDGEPIDLPQNTEEIHRDDCPITPQQLFEALLLDYVIVGEDKRIRTDYKAMAQKLDRSLRSFRTANLFQILGLTEKARTAEIQRAYAALQRAFVLPEEDANCPADVAELARKVHSLLKNAYETLRDEGSRNAYLKELQIKKSQEILDLEPIFRTAILELTSERFIEAAKSFDDLIGKRANFRDLKSYRLWAHIKAGSGLSLDLEFEQIPPEGRYSPIYLMARGLFFASRMNFEKAMECLNNALMLDPNFKAARIELENVMELRDHTQSTFIVREVKGAINTLLGKKGKSGKKRSA